MTNPMSTETTTPSQDERIRAALFRALRLASEMADPNWCSENERLEKNIQLIAVLSDALLDIDGISQRKL